MRPIASPRVVLACLALLLGAACTPVVMPMGPAIAPPALAQDAVVAADGARLPMRAFPPDGRADGVPPRAVLLALHGFNDHSGNFLTDSIGQLNAGGLLVYAYDQRGFGRSPNRGYWPGEATLAEDAATAARLLRARHPGLPLFLMGESMGGAVAVVAGTSADPPPVDGYVLLAPALWGRASMNAVMRGGLWVAARTMPILGFQGGVGGIVASDNMAALRRLGRDPLVLRSTRVDAAVGLVDLMDAATAALPTCCRDAAQRPVPVLLLYGDKDSLIPARPVRRALNALPPDSPVRIGIHEEGFHLLLTDSNRAAVVGDILAFTADPAAPLPSGADRFSREWLAR
ncbi:alpha/beta hydrolase [Roseomonas frigidaquae]|uniref:Alpha/beta hydrolase n=1 Tax=Falsiroseomonas frigidaquae TaxID=487318 RepID=A0ABX1EYE2_9PROT|nr:alpha/beta fold hydrolase [Falsiroseomonas frigidaquae]NKE45073.1 alpha/beta hydrolase [Falsiroseomonas frigidaquae]